MRLIDADTFVKRFNNLCETDTDKRIACIVMGAIASEPTAYDMDKVVEELKEMKTIDGSMKTKLCIKFDEMSVNKAIEIVKQGLREQNK